jgi:hypothetical protein
VSAWVYFNGTGTPSITRDAGVSSIGDNGTGDYTVNFDSSFVDEYYAVAGTASLDFTQSTSIYNTYIAVPRRSGAQAAGSCRIACEYPGTLYDCVAVRVIFTR